MLSDFHWLRPDWLWAIPVIVALALLLAKGRLGAGNWATVIDAALMPHVLSQTPGRGRDQRWWLFGIAGVLASVALAGPAWERIEQPVFRAEQALVIALDLSRSMDATDIAPSRLSRAQLKILDMLQRRSSGETALIVYSANAFTVTPLTTDTDTIASLVNSLSTDIMPSRGSYPEVAIDKAEQLLEQAGAAFGEVLLVTDGGSSPAASERARALRAAGYSLSILGVGTSDGAPIPQPDGGFVTDNRGRIAVPQLEASGLRALANSGGGRYATLSPGDSDLDYLLSGEINGAGRVASDDALATDRWREEGPWLVLLLLPLAALAFRRGWVLLVLVFVLPVPTPAYAASWSDLWLNKNQQAERALQQGDAALAADLFDDQEWQAVARYRAENYADSAALFAERGDARNLYNLGNAMAMQGRFAEAIDAYEQTLEIEADNEDASYNLELVRRMQEQQEQDAQNQGDDQQSNENPGGQGEQSDEENASEDQGDMDQQSDGNTETGEASDRDDEEMSAEDMQALQEELQRAAEEAEQGEAPPELSEEQLAELRRQQAQEQAMEQWLRRIPDDPGGLLRRKFRHQYRITGTDQDGNAVWPDNEVQPW